MRKTIWALVGLFAITAAPGWAAAPTAEQNAARAKNVASVNAELNKLDARQAKRGTATSTSSNQAGVVTATTSATPAPPFANSYRAYPASCLADPLPFDIGGPRWSRTVNLARYNPNTDAYTSEDVTISVWRVPCSSSGQFANSATLVGIDRAGSVDGTSPYPLFPEVRVTQGNNTQKLARIATEPNTVLSHVSAGIPVLVSQTFVLENFASTSSNTAFFDYNAAFTLTFYNGYASDTGQSLTIPGYAPNQTDYPDAYKPLPITGYLSGNWYDANHNGEGMLIQTFEIPGNTTSVVFTYAWFTYDAQGLPYWLFGGATVPAGTRGSITVPTVFYKDGGFAGSFGANATSTKWGDVTFTFDSCGSMDFTFASSTTAAAPPKGTGTRTWTRPLDINALSCE